MNRSTKFKSDGSYFKNYRFVLTPGARRAQSHKLKIRCARGMRREAKAELRELISGSPPPITSESAWVQGW